MSSSAMIVDPAAAPAAAPSAEPKAWPFDGLAGKVVGFVDNVKPNFHFLADDIAEILRARHGVTAIVRHRKRTASVPAPDEIMADIARQCDLVITGSGD